MSGQGYSAQSPLANSATSGASGAMYNPPPEPKPKKSEVVNMFDKVGKTISKGFNSASKKANKKVDQIWSSSTLDMFNHGNTVQLISRSSERTLQIVTGPAGTLMLDAMGSLDHNAFNTLWMVVNEGNNQVRLHNYNNFIGVINGQAVIVPVPVGSPPGPETRFQLSQVQNFVILESLTEQNCHLGFLNTGELKNAAVTPKEINSQFGVKLVSSAHP